MSDSLGGPMIKIFPLLIGIFAIALVIMNKQLLRLLGLKPLSEAFTNPRFQKSAEITEKLGHVFMILFGVSFIVEGLGPLFLPSDVSSVASLVILGLCLLIVLAVIAVNLVHWKAGD
jgi:protein-S-isoprenylcysteine O-methyltransferase Ste14